MKVSLIAVGKSMPTWLKAGYQEYCKRLPAELGFKLVEIEPAKRSKQQSTLLALQQESDRMLSKIPAQSFVVACDEHGELWDTSTLATKLSAWLQTQQTVCFLIGGADGYSQACLARANVCWSLSRLTFPHLLVRLMVVEQLYRATAILAGHPYHRADVVSNAKTKYL